MRPTRASRRISCGGSARRSGGPIGARASWSSTCRPIKKPALPRRWGRRGSPHGRRLPVQLLLDESVPLLHVPPLWGGTLQGSSVRVAIVDMGVDATHPDLLGRIATHADFSGAGERDDVGHGTHVAGIVGGTGAVVCVAAGNAGARPRHDQLAWRRARRPRRRRRGQDRRGRVLQLPGSGPRRSVSQARSSRHRRRVTRGRQRVRDRHHERARRRPGRGSVRHAAALRADKRDFDGDAASERRLRAPPGGRRAALASGQRSRPGTALARVRLVRRAVIGSAGRGGLVDAARALAIVRRRASVTAQLLVVAEKGFVPREREHSGEAEIVLE